MTTQEMITSFGLNYASEINSNVPGLLNSEIVAFLNQAQDDVIIQACENKTYTYIEPLRQRSSELNVTVDSLIQNAFLSSISGISDYFYPIKSYAKLTRTDYPTISTAKWYECNDAKKIKDSIHKYIYNNYNKPVYEIPMWYIDGTNIVVLADSYSTVSKIVFEYIKNPTQMDENSLSVEPDIHATLHPVIVDRAVEIAIEIFKDERIKTHRNTAI